MKNTDLAKKIKELRNRKGMSQEELAEASGLNLRTIQRIENGETEARGDSMKRLARALNVTPDELIDWAEEEDRGFLAFLNLSALSFLAFPLLGIIIPLALWFMKKDKIKNLNQIGKKLINFQITWCMAFFGVFIFLFLGSVMHLGLSFSMLNLNGAELLLTLFIPLIYIFNIILIIVNSITSYNNKRVFYQPAIPFLR
ncbi:transcriptional regulator with XRE-family HTH domain [Pedobacter africanus]|uniref:Transcriptional regulator with XRE-family HTH domain n=1 Tax=Pedobacter africanus TaxID=151894 RepID=A0ACC6L3L5_9SPHI|nr:helix-turn-helix domain-containing protein [Pedobacter africanus]MDR6786102.1 transcriptional regulator with XRE-family HTH domain [Pedobacter africanus]